ncbi:MAG: oligopeptide transporter, OPT family [Candidatus Wallbacteria bacterium HGW-Wallbacteria-1]|jgi:putative OPT family oligopeptide transporter|uniref:Oligopeptide transporter, OPT family n=1 Tax=Candidatus Wallbacteria bacterium HGW-Wallbacteria-1 TaxID=2013854 RepID=A0A2N1PHT2_9BACT|nr:MAG: oligopeptide transporter, OPT family [Candidatus Wallbacteria bacterium HGW-Wallbacteria-1]
MDSEDSRTKNEGKGLSPLAYQEIDGDQYEPFVSADREDVPELTLKAILTGVVIGVVFGAANAYLGLRVGLTVSASIPAAVMGVAAFKFFGKGSILEANLVQTVGSAGESLAAGVIFTLPALFMWNLPVGQLKICVLALLGGLLGVLFMIPLRRYLIVREHGKLPYPEGTACAEVLVAGETGGSKARLLFAGLGLGAIYQSMVHDRFLKLWNKAPSMHIPGYRGGEIAGDLTPELLGIGFIIGPKISAVMLSGGVLGWLVLIPLIYLFGDQLTVPVFPEAVTLIRDMSPAMVWSRYIRYIGAGAVAFAGIFTLIKSLPTIFESFKLGIGGMAKGGQKAEKRTQRDLPMTVVFGGVILLIAIMAFLPESFVPVGFAGAGLIALFSFFFVTVSSRIVGLIGSSSNPVSGMTIATLLLTCLIFMGLGMADNPDTAKVAVLVIGSIVCIAAAIAGDTSQDLKTGFLVGATPRSQQIGEIIGVATASLVMGATIFLLKTSYGFGAGPGMLPAPQASLMKMVVEGVLGGNLPWTLVIIGMFISFVVEILGLPALALAVGLYLPLELSTPIMAGGILRLLVEKVSAARADKGQDEREKGILFSSGLIAGAALAGVVIAGLVYLAEPSPSEKGKADAKPGAVKNFLEYCGRSGVILNSVPEGYSVNLGGSDFTPGQRLPIMSAQGPEAGKVPIVISYPDGQKFSSILEASPGSRVYLDVSAKDGKVTYEMNSFTSWHGKAGLMVFLFLCFCLAYVSLRRDPEIEGV